MILVFTGVALAIEPAFECTPLTEPADGFPFAQPGLVSGAVHDRLLAWAEATYDDDCPMRCEGGGDDDCAYSEMCTTDAGTEITVEYSYTFNGVRADEAMNLLVEEPSGASLSLTSTAASWHVYGAGAVTGSDLTWSARWAALGDPMLPELGAVDVQVSTTDNADWPFATIEFTEDWQDEAGCDWSATYRSAGYYGTYSDGWGIAMGDQWLVVTGDWWDVCGGTHPATLDDVSYLVVADTWEIATDADGDGAEEGTDCDDADAARSACLAEIPCNGVDDNCDTSDDTDADGDGHEAECTGGDDCDDTRWDVHPGATDIPNGEDEDCDGVDDVDNDGDGKAAIGLGGEECDDADPSVYPHARETQCDAIDQDCDGEDLCYDEEEPDPPAACGSGGGGAALIAMLLAGPWRRRGSGHPRAADRPRM